jgi:hydrogenase maturation protease
MLIERYEQERPAPEAAPRLGDARVLADGWDGPLGPDEHEAQINAILGGPNLKVSL